MLSARVSNRSTPNGAHVSPRLGFAWQYRPTVGAGASGTNTTGRIFLPPRATLSGGIGEFRQTATAAAIFPAISGTGLGAAGAHITCMGSTSPTPDWQTLIQDPSASPSVCATGSPTQFIEAAPSRINARATPRYAVDRVRGDSPAAAARPVTWPRPVPLHSRRPSARRSGAPRSTGGWD